MSTAYPSRAPSLGTPAVPGAATLVAGLLGAMAGGGALAALLATGRAQIALLLLVSIPIGLLLARHPQSVLVIWLAMTPFLVATDGGMLRKVYWVVHRALPVAVLVWIVLGAIAKTHSRRLPRLGWPEVAMGGYLAVSVVSVVYTSPEVSTTLVLLYDRVFAPMCLYLLVRLLQPTEGHFRAVLPAVVFVLLTQAAIGMASWWQPDLLYEPWLDRAGTRTTGSLDHPNVYGTTMLFAGLLVLNAVHAQRAPTVRRALLRLCFPLALVMVFMTYSRASWLAAIVVLLGLLAVQPGYVARLTVVAALVVFPLVASGAVAARVEMAQNRFYSASSEESALSRLPVFYASLQMLREKPFFGWGYGNFDRFDRQFQGAVGGLVTPEKDHASHNLYLTILAEQGTTGLLLYAVPVLWWLARTPRALHAMPRNGLLSRNLLIILWLVMAAFVVVSNYANVRVVYGLGLWWLTLGAIAALVNRYATAHPTGPQPRPNRLVARGQGPAAAATLPWTMRGGAG